MLYDTRAPRGGEPIEDRHIAARMDPRTRWSRCADIDLLFGLDQNHPREAPGQGEPKPFDRYRQAQ